MSYIPITPFGRAMTGDVIEHHNITCEPLPETGVNKYDILRELTAARVSFGLSDRTLGVLQALLSFHPETLLDPGPRSGLTVFPSNKSICERLNGMACSTMRRHLASLVNAGLIVRRDSPNGKRFVKRSSVNSQAFGFDLTPLVTRYNEIHEIAVNIRKEVEEFDTLRRTVSLMRRDLAGLAELGAQMHPDSARWDAFSDAALLAARQLRRKLTIDELMKLEVSLQDLLDAAKTYFNIKQTSKMNTNDAQNEQHHHSSNKDKYRSNKKNQRVEKIRLSRQTDLDDDTKRPNVPIGLVATVCLEIGNYSSDRIRTWEQMIEVTKIVRPMMGISSTVWKEAIGSMGAKEVAVVIACMLEKFTEIKSPSAYLKALTKKADLGRFSSGPMVMALARKEGA